MTPRRVLGGLLLAALSAACHKTPSDPAIDPPTVHVATVATGTLSEWLRYSGRVVPPPDRDATLAPRVDGVLSEVNARVGERVVRGKVLARVDTATLTDALSAAEATENGAAAEADAKRRAASRTRALVTRGVVSGEQAESDEAAAAAAEAVLSQAKAARAAALRRRGWAELTAPFDGVVVRILRQKGEPVDGTSATPVVELAAEHPVQIALDAPAAGLSRLKVGQTADIALGAAETAPLPAQVASVAAAVDPVTGTGSVRLAPLTENSGFVLGRVVEARIAVAEHRAVVFVPKSALRGGAAGAVEAVVVVEHRAHVRKVVEGLHDGDRVEILSGLAAGDAVVVDDPVGLADDAPVRDGP